MEIEVNRLDRAIQKAKSTLEQTQRQVKASEREHNRNMSELSRLRNTGEFHKNPKSFDVFLADGLKKEIGRLRTEKVEV